MVTKETNKNSYSEQEIELLNEIVECHQIVEKCHQTIADKNYSIGDSCDQLIKIHNGTVYGGQTFQRVSDYLKQKGITNCTIQHLRHCWHYYQLMTDPTYASDNLTTLGKKSSAVFHLCRVLETDLPEKEKVAMVNKLVGWAIKRNLSVDDFGDLVSSTLREKGVGQTRKSKSQKSEPVPKDSLVECEKGFEHYDFLVRAVTKSTDLSKNIMGTQDKCCKLVSRLKNQVLLVEKIPACYRNKELKKELKDIADRLSQILK